MTHDPLIATHQHPIPEFYKRALETVSIHGSGENPWADWSEAAAPLEALPLASIPSLLPAFISAMRVTPAASGECNEDSARMVANHPQRFGAFAILPQPDVGAAVREPEYALDTLKLEGFLFFLTLNLAHDRRILTLVFCSEPINVPSVYKASCRRTLVVGKIVERPRER